MKNKNFLLEKFSEIPPHKGFKRFIVVLVKVILVSIHRFMKDDCLTRASAIAYTNIVSLVPVLTVALALLTITSGVNEKQEILFDTINSFLIKNEIRVDMTPYFETLKDIIASATQIGAVGFIVLIFSATAILRTFEAAFNQIWRITIPRSFSYKMIFYFFILSIGPLLGAVFMGFASKLADAVRSSHLYSITKSKNDSSMWITGENGTILKIDESGKKLLRFKDLKIDTENIICINLENGEDTYCELPKLAKENYIKIRTWHNQLVVMSEKGVYLESRDLGLTWSITYFLNTQIVDFSIADDKNTFILTSEGNLFSYHGKKKFTKYNLNYQNSSETVFFTRVRFPDALNGYLVDKNGFFWKTANGGKSFTEFRTNSKSTKVTLNDMAIIDLNSYIVVGDRGSMFLSKNGGKDWSDVSHKRSSILKIWHIRNENRDELIALNEIGDILYSYDLGDKWQISHSSSRGKLNAMLPINPKFGFSALNPEDDDVPNEEELKKQKEQISAGDILAVGEFGKISIGDLKDNQLLWKNITGGDAIFSLYSLINTIIPLFAIWLFFLMLYMLIPNTKVPLKAASSGAALTGIILLIFIYSFGIYIRSFSTSTLIIYRALAAVPIFLLFVYCLSIIMLFGAEITATLHHKERYDSSRNPFEDGEDDLNYSFYYSIHFLILIYEYQKKEKKLIQLSQIKQEVNLTPKLFDSIFEKLIQENIIAKLEDGSITPCRFPSDMDLYTLFLIMTKESLTSPVLKIQKPFIIKIDSKLKSIDSFTKENLQNINFMELLSE
jgi:membrane protein